MAQVDAHQRKQAVSDLKRGLILDAARRVFEKQGLEGASLRGIATEAGYTPAALYFHFDSKEAIYAALLQESLGRLGDAVIQAVSGVDAAAQRLKDAAMAFFHFYAKNPHDLELGFYLYRGGVKPSGVGPDRDPALNDALAFALDPICQAAMELGANEAEATLVMVDVFAHATGFLVLTHTGRIRMFGVSAEDRMHDYVAAVIGRIAHRAE
jgi:AcrR family transcriptional regulator